MEVRVFPFDDESAINKYFLQKIVYSGTRHGLSYQMFELGAFGLYPILSEYGTIWIDYSPQNKQIVFKSLKYFFNSLCNVEIFQEYVKY